MEHNKVDVELIKVKGFVMLHVLSDPERIESKVVFDRDNISQKLIFTLMDISHQHGFGCSSPHFNGPEDPTMTFLVGSILPTKRSLNKYIKRMYVCLEDIKDFSDDFNKQLDFSQLDLTMFVDMDPIDFYPEQIAAIRDQHFGGSWRDFKEALLAENKEAELEVVDRCVEFEKLNKKDIGLVGHKLNYIINLLGETNSEVN